MTDAALLHTILCGSALFSHLLTGGTHSVEAYTHMKDSVHLISTQLQDPENEISDATLVSVAHLANFECISGNYDNWKLHIKGLHKMVMIRGDIETLDEDLRNKIIIADISGCVATLSRPHFTLTSSKKALTPNFPDLSEGFYNLAETCSFEMNLVTILEEIQHLSFLLIQTPLDIPAITTAITTLQHRLLIYHHTGYTRIPLVQELYCIAALLYLITISTSNQIFGPVGIFPHGNSTNIVLIQRLKALLDSRGLELEGRNTFVLWVLFQAGIAVGQYHDRTCFVGGLMEVTRGMGIGSWKEVERELKRYIWPEVVCGIEGMKLWDEVVNLREVDR
ncbi:hypothetical protein BJ875DRAFT_444926 [Amylocarpus encephaloides]|uniref:Transcription factor domain-containing protein n=1 Tax=Amylocarpus encephaloides TaxID=45428 RepID=A0A9P8C1K0_9HELO|nr:hypothetical protein BJ875DRAFT_444926 [Amylocarpus encephaloides]